MREHSQSSQPLLDRKTARRRFTLAVMFALAALGTWPVVAVAQGGPPSKGKIEKVWNPATRLPELIDEGIGAGLNWAKQHEFVQMFDAVVGGSMMGPGDGWFHPSRTKFGWPWLAYHFDKNFDGKITLAEFGGPAHVFKKLDRNGDGVLTAEDFDWSFNMPSSKSMSPELQTKFIFSLMDGDRNGKISLEEWQRAFQILSSGKDHMTPQDLAKMFLPPSPPKGGGGMPSKAILLKGLFTGELGSAFEGPAVGTLAPDFTLKTQDEKQTISLGQFRHKKPVVLIFGSFT